jgi:hypothetical protein
MGTLGGRKGRYTVKLEHPRPIEEVVNGARDYAEGGLGSLLNKLDGLWGTK